ncbi:MAG: hypothetical protein CVV25_03970 [Ignavibacteriae bacterium HGW-Ignavibacteriae-4]|jgi:integrase|nr:MAG: hypothetical protein CVV25_03970 [Ignavibacteriae bacterium HGW-Ignavibacteriae-4]
MIRVKFNLLNKHNKLSPLTVSASWDGLRQQKSLGQTVPTIHWDLKKSRLKAANNKSYLFNNYLNEVEKSIIEFYNETISYSTVVTKKQIKDKIEDILSKGVEKDKKNLSVVDVFNTFLEVYTKDGKRPKVKTMEGYINTRNKLTRYQREKKVLLQFDDINLDFYNDFVEYLYGKKNTAATIGTNISKIITFMNWTKRHKYHNSSEYMDFKVLKGEPLFTTVLREEEYKRISELNFDNPDIEFARLFLLVNCNIGLRYSDLLEVIKEFNVFGDEMTITQIKTNAKTRLPINQNVKDMLGKLKSLYRSGIDRKIINAGLKEVGKSAEMNDIETSVKIIGNYRETIKKYRWELLSTHVGRRTFATRAAEKGTPLHIIMLYTGHKNLSTLQKYIKSSSFAKQNIIEDLWEL